MTEVKHPTITSNLYRSLSAVCRVFTVSRVLRALQLIFAILVAGLYGVDLAHFTRSHTHANAEWIYAEFIAAISGTICLVFSFMTSIHVAWSILDATIFVLWLAQVGVFGSIFYPEVRPDYATSTLSVSHMRAAVWIDLINMLLWLLSTVLRVAWYINARKHHRRINASKRDATPFLGLLGRGKNLQRYGEQEHGCLGIDQPRSNGIDTKILEKRWADGTDLKKSEKNMIGGLDVKMAEKMSSDDESALKS